MVDRKEMRERIIERFVLLPFSLGCVSESSIAVGANEFLNRKRNSNSTPTSLPLSACNPEDEKDEEEEYGEDDQGSLSDENLKSPRSLLAAPKFQRLLKNFKNLSQLFVYKDDDDDEMQEEDDMSMEIGFPTDVKHVTHIGIDGSTTSLLSKGWDNLKVPEFDGSATSILSKGWDHLKEPEFNPRGSVSFAPSEPTQA